MSREPEFDLATVALRGTFWVLVSRISAKAVSFIAMLVLTRLLSREEFGVAAYAIATIQFLMPVSDLGVQSSLIFHKENRATSSTAFWLMFFIASVLCLLLWVCAPLVAQFFNDPRAILMTRVLAFHFPIAALATVQESLIQKQLAFQSQIPPAVIRAITKGVCSIVFALVGLGPLSLIAGSLAGDALRVIAYWWLYPWRPSFQFDRAVAAKLLSYGKDVTALSLFTALMLNADYFMVGHLLGATMLGLYTVGFRIPDLLIGDFCSMLSKVLFPVYVKIQNDSQSLATAFLESVRHVSMITVPLAAGAILLAEPFMLTFFSPEWAAAVPVVQGISIYAVMLSISRQAGNVAKALGRLSSFLMLNIVRAMLLLPALYWAASEPATIGAVAAVQAGVATIFTTAQLAVCSRMLGVSLRSILAAVAPAALCTALMAVVVAPCVAIISPTQPTAQFLFGFSTALIVYIFGSWHLQQETLLKVRRTLASTVAKR